MKKKSRQHNILFILCLWGAVIVLFVVLFTLIDYIKPTETLSSLLSAVFGGT